MRTSRFALSAAGAGSVAVALACLALAPSRADAQLGALRARVQKKIGEQIDHHAPADSARSTSAGGAVSSSAASAAAPSENTVTLTPDVVDRVLRGVAAEDDHERGRQATIAANAPASNSGAGNLAPYFSCMQTWQATAEAERLDAKRTAAHRARRAGTGTAAAAADADSAYQHGIDKQCGTLQDAEAKAAASDRARETARADTRDVGPATAQLTPMQFAVARERLMAFALLAGPRAECMQRSLHYAYSDAEVAALTPRASQIVASLATPHDSSMALGGYCRSSTPPTHVMHAVKKTAGH